MVPDRRSARALVLFDIDGTLVRRAGPHHRQALVEAVRRTTGLETTTDGIPVHGMLDPDILAIMMRKAGASELLIRRNMAAIVKHAQVTYVRHCPSLKRKVCPGVRSLLAHLRHLHLPMGLVTGNLTRIGWKKLERAGLKHHFCLGAFGEMSRDRAGLVRIAIRQARDSGWVRNSTRISLIGDSPADIQAARANRVQSIAVLTGISARQELAAESPDVLVKDLRTLGLEKLLHA